MAHTIFILGTDPQQCKELREILQERIADNIVTAHRDDNLPNIKESDTVIITSEEKNTGILYRRLLKGELLSDVLVRRQPVVISNLQQANMSGEMRGFVEKYALVSLLAVPIQTKDVVLGAFISLAAESGGFSTDDVATASALADFT